MGNDLIFLYFPPQGLQADSHPAGVAGRQRQDHRRHLRQPGLLQRVGDEVSLISRKEKRNTH